MQLQLKGLDMGRDVVARIECRKFIASETGTFFFSPARWEWSFQTVFQFGREKFP